MDSASLTHTIVSVIYYIILIPLAVFSAFGIYIYIRYGESRTFTLITSAVYIALFLILISASHSLLRSI